MGKILTKKVFKYYPDSEIESEFFGSQIERSGVDGPNGEEYFETDNSAELGAVIKDFNAKTRSILDVVKLLEKLGFKIVEPEEPNTVEPKRRGGEDLADAKKEAAIRKAVAKRLKLRKGRRSAEDNAKLEAEIQKEMAKGSNEKTAPAKAGKKGKRGKNKRKSSADKETAAKEVQIRAAVRKKLKMNPKGQPHSDIREKYQAAINAEHKKAGLPAKY